MKLIFTSFGVTQELEHSLKDVSLFYRMPPVSMRTINNTFLPDYAVLLLCEKIILDESSFTTLQEKSHWSYTVVAKALKSLYAEGFIELVDFNRILRHNQALLQRMLEHDLKILDQWIVPLKQSVDIWYDFTRRAFVLMKEERMYHNHFLHSFESAFVYHGVEPTDEELEEALSHLSLTDATHREDPVAHSTSHLLSKRTKAEYRDALRKILHSYLSHVNANIVLSNELGTGFHDWEDFLPFYRQKFLFVGREDLEAQQHIEAAQRLFEVSFPEFAITDTATLIKVLHDRRVADLRQLVQDAVEGKVVFDKEFARSVFKEVLGVEEKIAMYRRIISYLTMPLGFLPWVGTFAQKATEETIGTLVEKKFRQKYRWFYLLSNLPKTP